MLSPDALRATSSPPYAYAIRAADCLSLPSRETPRAYPRPPPTCKCRARSRATRSTFGTRTAGGLASSRRSCPRASRGSGARTGSKACEIGSGALYKTRGACQHPTHYAHAGQPLSAGPFPACRPTCVLASMPSPNLPHPHTRLSHPQREDAKGQKPEVAVLNGSSLGMLRTGHVWVPGDLRWYRRRVTLQMLRSLGVVGNAAHRALEVRRAIAEAKGVVVADRGAAHRALEVRRTGRLRCVGRLPRHRGLLWRIEVRRVAPQMLRSRGVVGNAAHNALEVRRAIAEADGVVVADRGAARRAADVAQPRGRWQRGAQCA
eukprot:364599-Chlamydomonas_euryale.AAC.4